MSVVNGKKKVRIDEDNVGLAKESTVAKAATESTLALQPQVPTTVLADEKIVTSKDTPEALGSGAIKNSVLVQAKSDNTDKVYIGNASKQEVELAAGENVVVVADNLNKIYVKVSVDGEGVNYVGG